MVGVRQFGNTSHANDELVLGWHRFHGKSRVNSPEIIEMPFRAGSVSISTSPIEYSNCLRVQGLLLNGFGEPSCESGAA